MKPIGNGKKPKSIFKGVRLSGQAMMSMVAASAFMSLVTLSLVIYSYYAIPARVERERQGRIEELQALTDLIDNANDLTEVVQRLINAETDPARNPR